MMTVATATAMLTVVVVVMLMIVVIMVVMIVMMLFIVMMTVAAAVTMLTVVVVMMLMIVVIMIVMVVVMLFIVMMTVAAAIAMLTMVVVVMLMIVMIVVLMMLVLLLERLYSILKSVLMLHCGKDLLAVKAVPRCCDKNCALVMLTKKLYALSGLLLACRLGMRKHDRRCIGNLVVIELAKVLHIHLALLNVGNGGKAIKHSAVLLCSLCRANNVRKLANARGLDNNSVGIIFLKHLNKCL